MIKTVMLILALSAFGFISAQQKILFDNTKSETASNADWVIDRSEPIPSPDQSGITSSTSEDYWDGAISAWGVEMVKRGFTAETLPSSASITYGDGNNSQDLSNYDIFVVCEPNNPFTETEKTAILNFVSNGGGLFMVTDHYDADRDGDGWDAYEIWNDLMTDNSVQNNPFGMSFDDPDFINDYPNNNMINDSSDPLLHGAAGDVTGMEFHGSASMSINTTANSTVKAVVYRSGYPTTGTSDIMVAYCQYGQGRVVGLVDSSPADDGTGDPNDNLYYGWDELDNGVLITNATLWLAESGTTTINPEPTGNVTNFSVSGSTSSEITLTWTDATGEQLPDAYLIKATNNIGSISDPTDGTVENNSTYIQNVSYGTQSVTFTDFTASTTYEFKIYPYTNSGTDIDYLVSSTPTIQGSTTDCSIRLNYLEDFEGTTPDTPVDFPCWTNYTEAGSVNWIFKNYESNNYAQMTAYNTNDNSNIVWLITPPVLLDNSTDEILTFDTKTGFYVHDALSVWVSQDYDGTDPTTATWTELSATFAADPVSGSDYSDWVASGNIDLSGYNGSVHIAFKYTGSDTNDETTAFQLDNIAVNGQNLVAIETLNSNLPVIFPNPTNGQFNIKFETKYQISITDISGKLIYENPHAENNTVIDLSKQTKGIYFVKITQNNAVYVSKLILN